MRIYIRKNSSDNSIGKVRLDSLMCYEFENGYEHEKVWIDWFKYIEELKQKTVSFIKQAKSDGKTIWAYGASTKGNTLLQYFGLDNTLIDAIAERNPTKYGLRTIGSNIPIKSEEEMREAQPDYLLILPWHFIKEFTTREINYLKNGGRFIVPCPQFKIISYEDTK